MQFRLTDNPPVKGVVLFLLFAAAVGEIAIFALLYVTDEVESALAAGITIVVMAVAVAISAWLMNRGEIKLTDQRLEVRTVTSKQLIAWTDIAGARVRTVGQLGKGDRFFAALVGRSEDICLVEVELKRPFRFALLPGQQDGTDAIGLPGLASRRIRIYVSDTEGLVHAIDAHLGVAE